MDIQKSYKDAVNALYSVRAIVGIIGGFIVFGEIVGTIMLLAGSIGVAFYRKVATTAGAGIMLAMVCIIGIVLTLCITRILCGLITGRIFHYEALMYMIDESITQRRILANIALGVRKVNKEYSDNHGETDEDVLEDWRR